MLKVGDTVFDADLAGSAPLGALERLRAGSVVAVTGVYAYQPGPAPTFRLLLRTPSDVVVLSAAPWWTMFRRVMLPHLMPAIAAGALFAFVTSFDEVILATNLTAEGESTASYLAEVLKGRNIRVSRIAYGLPMGADLEYADEVTVGRAMKGRREL